MCTRHWRQLWKWVATTSRTCLPPVHKLVYDPGAERGQECQPSKQNQSQSMQTKMSEYVYKPLMTEMKGGFKTSKSACHLYKQKWYGIMAERGGKRANTPQGITDKSSTRDVEVMPYGIQDFLQR